MPKFNQKGLAPLIFVIIAGVVIAGVIALSKGDLKKQPGNQNAQQTESSTNSNNNQDKGVKWQTYTSDEYGYTFKIPSGWKVIDIPKETSREIIITHPQTKAMVSITALKDERIKDVNFMKDSIAKFIDKLKNDPVIVRIISEPNQQVTGNKGTFIVKGEEKKEGKNWYFEQRGVLSTDGKVLLFYGKSLTSEGDVYTNIVTEIIDSYTPTDQKNETTKDEIKGVPPPVSEFMDNKDITKLETGGLSVNKGDSPPNIEGSYKADNFVATYVSIVKEGTTKVGETISKGSITFSNQKNDGSISIDTGTGGFESRSTSISGKDSCFTVYDEENFNKRSCKYTMAFVVSGCKVDKGLADFQVSSLMKSKTGEGCNTFAPLGYTIVAKEEDGLLKRMK